MELTLAEHGGDPLVCALCGKELLRLGSHLRRVHDVSVADYRAALGLAHTRPVDRARYRELATATFSAREDRAAAPDPDEQRLRSLSGRTGFPAAEISAVSADAARTRNAATAEAWQRELDRRARDLGYRDAAHAVAMTVTQTAVAVAALLKIDRQTVARLRAARQAPATRAARIPTGLHDELAALAAARQMSTTAYVVQLLERHITDRRKP